MKKELSVSIIIFILLMIAFIFSVKVSEQQNNNYLRQKYVQSQTQINTAATIPAPTEKAVEYQNKKVIIWVTSLVLGMVVPAFFCFQDFLLE